jgi:hypothetical protein
VNAPQKERAAAGFATLTPQTLAVVAAILIVTALHWDNNGLWFQGDAPRHAINGLFLWDLLTTLPTDPLDFTLSYYARYPVIAPLVYPPLFYLLEGAAFWAVAPSPYVAKLLVLLFATVAGIYVMAWARRWIAPEVGWAGVCAVLTPGFIQFSNGILLNVPATALGLGVLYHLRAWLETGSPRHRFILVAMTAAMALVYFPSLIVLPVGIAWTLCMDRRVPATIVWVLTAGITLLIITAMTVLPAHLSRNAPDFTSLFSAWHWAYYVSALDRVAGTPWMVLGFVGTLVALTTRAYRHEGVRLALVFVIVMACLVTLPARDPRYLLLLAPVCVLAAFTGLAACAGHMRQPHATGTAVALALVMAGWSAHATPVRIVSGLEEVAAYLRSQGPHDAVLYSGRYDGVFGFHVRALDPGFERRVVLSHKLLYNLHQPPGSFEWVETPHVNSPSDVVDVIRSRSGCRWVAVEIAPEAFRKESDKLLHQALEGPEFELVRSFPVIAGVTVRVDLYRFLPPLDPPPPMDVVFSSFSNRVFPGIEPIGSRR